MFGVIDTITIFKTKKAIIIGIVVFLFVHTQPILAQSDTIPPTSNQNKETLFTFYIPNAFTPNNDGLNDVFYGKGEGIIQYDMWIFDRWGNMIFHGKE